MSNVIEKEENCISDFFMKGFGNFSYNLLLIELVYLIKTIFTLKKDFWSYKPPSVTK